MHKLRFRQIHLDFHTSPEIPGVGAAFDARQWQDALKRGHVDSVTTFAVCHHGWHYHKTSVGAMHPHLTFDLLRAQFDAAKAIDVNVPVYITAGVNNRVSHEHPEWREVGWDGRYNGWARNVTDPGFHKLCFNSPYLDLLVATIRETVTLFPACDGIFLDIISQGECCCRWCLAVMDRHGWDAASADDRRRCSRLALMRYYEATTRAVRDLAPAMPVFHNSGHIPRGDREILPFFSHLELESLPTGGWGYDHFPISALYCRNLPLDFLGMTGKFHTTWGEFGGFKHPNALRYECAAMTAFGAKCSVGDQLHPSAHMDESTYDIVGQAYAEVERKEPWCRGTTRIADVAVLSIEAENPAHRRENAPDIGAGRVLLEGHILFDLIDREMPFDPYRVVILPDDIRIDPALETKLRSYLAAGGKLLASGVSGLRDDGSFVFDIGAVDEGESPFCPDFVRPAAPVRPDFVSSPFVAYLRGRRLRVTDGESLGEVFDPYFNRTFRHFCSHQHTPFRTEPSGYACGVRKGAIVHLAHPVFSWYRGYGAVAVRQYILKCIDLLLGEERTLEVGLPSAGRVTLGDQPAEQRYVLHLLYAGTISRGGNLSLSGGTIDSKGFQLEVIEDLVPLHAVRVRVKTPRPVRAVRRVPDGEPLEFQQTKNGVEFTVPRIECHEMIELSYAAG